MVSASQLEWAEGWVQSGHAPGTQAPASSREWAGAQHKAQGATELRKVKLPWADSWWHGRHALGCQAPTGSQQCDQASICMDQWASLLQSECPVWRRMSGMLHAALYLQSTAWRLQGQPIVCYMSVKVAACCSAAVACAGVKGGACCACAAERLAAQTRRTSR